MARTTDRQLLAATLALTLLGACGAPPASGPGATPRISCVGVPDAKCDEAVASVARSLPNTPVVAIEVSCVSGTCTDQSGAMDTVVTTADGATLRGSTLSWSEPATGGGSDGSSGAGATAPPAPAPPAVGPDLPVEPTCLGVPVEWCRTMAETAFGSVPAADVVAITVRCRDATCNPQHGAGDTVVSYADGSRQSSSWEYAGG